MQCCSHFAKAWKEATAETSAENAVAKNMENQASEAKELVVGGDMQVRSTFVDL